MSRRDLYSETVHQLLLAELREKRLTPKRIVQVATQLLQFPSQIVSRRLFSSLRKEPSENVTANMLDILRELSQRDPCWPGILRKSVKKRGRCPRPLCRNVRQLLRECESHTASDTQSLKKALTELEGVTIEREDIPDVQGPFIEWKRPAFLFGRSSRARVVMNTDVTGIWHMESIAAMVEQLTPAPEELTLDFDGVDHVWVVGLAALAAWSRSRNRKVHITNASLRTNEYLRSMGFIDSLHGSTGGLTYSENTESAMAIAPLESEVKPEVICSRLVRIIDSHMSIPTASRPALSTLFAELIENIDRHAQKTGMAFACAQVYPKKRKLSICIVDIGIGVRNSILEGRNPELAQRVQQHESALELACKPLCTSKPDQHTGYGLYVASELIVRNGGVFRLFSGREILTLLRTKWRRKQRLARVPVGWNGTWIAMIIDLDHVLSVEDVYLTLPPKPGIDEEDFFE